MKGFRIVVPGSTANLGPGFDSIGLAINRYLTLDAVPSKRWQFNYVQSDYQNLPRDESNLIAQVVDYTLVYSGVKKDDRAFQVTIDCELPLARGLGSSAAATVAGIELANLLYGLDLSIEEKARIGSLYEGHPDNIGASLYGGLTIGTHSSEETFIIPWGAIPLELVIVVPRPQLLTSHSRAQLPESMSFKESVQASSYANVLIASLLKGDLEMAGEMMRRDLFHHPYRKRLVPQLEETLALLENEVDCGAALSGAGPSVLVFMKEGKSKELFPYLTKAFPDCEVECLFPEAKGLTVTAFNPAF
ncbi:homoserine kinase [Pullulanibacillus sp. KACC 23026]|uniref:homoserine kinase n=1 Tax=Pullulanibacillus sp. KACC 23026 TaxID=3028315 RepID=UPI0023B0205C|nr:homoserine kinase [Pullulanibacillus sp. KACC 23026]WEG10828.1 homoserine kinase [Pullulanibacillus sp. KACC 23026]